MAEDLFSINFFTYKSSRAKHPYPPLPFIFPGCRRRYRRRVKVFLRMSKFLLCACSVGESGKIQYGGVFSGIDRMDLVKNVQEAKAKVSGGNRGRTKPSEAKSTRGTCSNL